MANRITVLVDVATRNAEASLKKFTQGIREAEGASGKLKAGFTGGMEAIKSSGLLAGAALTTLVKGAGDAVRAASELEQSIGGVEKGYGDASEAVLALGDDAAEAMGLSKRAFNEGALAMSAFAETIAKDTGRDVQDVLNDLMTRAADFAAAYGTSVPEAVRIFSSTLSGESEPIKRFGIIVNETETKAYAASEGMSDLSKTTQRAGLLMRDTGKFAGQFADEGDTLAGATERARANIENFQAEIGARLLPVVADAAQLINNLVKAINWLEEKTNASLPGTKNQINVWSSLGDVFDEFGHHARVLGDVFLGIDYNVGQTADTVEDATLEFERNSQAMVQTSIDAAEFISTQDDVASSSMLVSNAIADAKDELDEQQKAFLEAKDAANEYVDSIFDAESASLDFQDSLADLAQQQADTDEIINDSTMSDAEKAQALRDLRGAQIETAQSALEAAQAYAEEQGAVEGSTKSVQDQIDYLSMLKGQYPEIADDLEAMIEGLLKVPGTVDPAMQAIGSGLAGGIGVGIANNAFRISDALLAAIQTGEKIVRQQYGIQSPSKVFADRVGNPIVEGIEQGVIDGAYKIGDALEDAIEDAEKKAIDAADELVDSATDALKGFWDQIDEGRSLEDMYARISEAQANYDAVLADPESTAKDKADALERLEDANYRLLKASTDALRGNAEERQWWMDTAAAAGLTKQEIDSLVASYDRLTAAKANAATAKATASAATSVGGELLADWDNAVRQGWISQDQLNVLRLARSPEDAYSYMKTLLNNIQQWFGWDVKKYHSGGVVPGPPGSEQLAILQAGETVVPRGGSMGGPVINLTVNALNPQQAGKEIVSALEAYYRSGGRRV